jgi:drug/metabolite transporter (DMT)-like permease
MNGLKIVGILLLVCGALSLAYGGFSYTKSRSDVDLGPISFQVTERERVNIPVWLGGALIVVGGGLLVGAGRRT